MSKSGKKGWIDPLNSITFKLVHPQTDAPGMVLQALQPSMNLQKKGFMPDLDFSLVDDGEESQDEGDTEIEEEGEIETKVSEDPSDFGVFYRDDYNYLRHMKSVGLDPAAVVMAAHVAKEEKPKGIQFVDSSDANALDTISELRSKTIVDVTEEEETIDPTVHEIFTALVDEAYVEDDVDDFFDAFHSEVIPAKYASKKEEEEEWRGEFRKFQEETEFAVSGDDDEDSMGVSSYHEQVSVKSKSKSKKAPSTAFSMTSSSMFRNEKLLLLDDQFDHVLADYSDDDIGELDPDSDSDLREGTEPVLEEMYDAFLEDLKIIGSKRVLISRKPEESLDAIRRELREESREIVEKYGMVEDFVEGVPMMPQMKKQAEWDVETVLTSNSNIYNRPRLIREISKGVPRIRLSRGMPRVIRDEEILEDEGSESEATESPGLNKGQARDQKETKEAKKDRKAAVKNERRERRITKKATTTAFQQEEGRQAKQMPNIKLQGHSQTIQ